MNNQIKNLISELKAIQIAEAQLNKLIAKKQSYQERIGELETRINYDSLTISKLSSNNLFSVYYLLIGEKTDSLDLLKRHYLQISIEYNDLVKSFKVIDFEIEVLKRKIENKKRVKQDLQLAFSTLESQIRSSMILEYKSILSKSDSKVRLVKEIKEAILAGTKINARFDQAYECLNEFTETLESRNYSKKRVATFKVRNIEKYQEIMIQINHDFILYEVELNDVYNEILNEKDYTSQITTNFMTGYRHNLAEDIRGARNLQSSKGFVKRYKEIFSGMHEVLSNDLRRIEQKLIELENEEQSFLSNFRLEDNEK